MGDQCYVCHKPATEVEFSNAQRKRLKKGKTATCKICSSPIPTTPPTPTQSYQCHVCKKPDTEVEFSNAQRKKLRKGQPGTCKTCNSQPTSTAPPPKPTIDRNLTQSDQCYVCHKPA